MDVRVVQWILSTILLAIPALARLRSNECYKYRMCLALPQPQSQIASINSAVLHHRMCQRLYKCPRNHLNDHPMFTTWAMSPSSSSTTRIKRSRRGLIFGRPFRRPPNSVKRPACRICEAKRTSCFSYYILTYGICGGAYLAGGNPLSSACNILTIPRTVDCMLNTYYNCFLNNCGLVGI